MTTNNHPAHGPVSLDRLHQIRETLSKAAAQSDGGNLGYAMADAVKVIDEVLEARNAEPVGYFYADKPGDWYQISDGDRVPSHRRIPLYASPQPSPVVKLPYEFISSEGIVVQIEKLMAVLAVHGIQYERRGNACRTAMLQAGNSPSKCSLRDGIEAIRNSGIPVDVDKIQSECEAGNHTEQHLDMVDNSGDDNEKVDCRLPFAQWLSQQNEPIDVDCGCVTTEAFYHWLRVAYEAGNSPVTPDGYVLVPKKLTAENGAKSVLSGEFSETKFINCPECFGDDDCETCDGSGRIEITVPVTWTTIKAIWAKGVEHFAAAPQQEVK